MHTRRHDEGRGPNKIRLHHLWKWCRYLSTKWFRRAFIKQFTQALVSHLMLWNVFTVIKTQTGRSGANETLKLINPRSQCFLYKQGTRIMSAAGFTRTFLKLCFTAPAVFITNYTHIISGMFHTPHSLHQSSEAFKWQVTLQTATGNTHWHVSACYMHSCCVSRNQSR